MADRDGVLRGTGRTREEWFAVLDERGAAERGYRDSARWLVDEHGLSGWWAQKLVVEYEQARGVRAPGVRRDGTFEVTASKTVAAPVDRVYEAFVDGRRRRWWLTDGKMTLRTAQPGKSARFEWEDGSTRVNVGFTATGPSKTSVAVAHRRLPDATTAAAAKRRWKERLAALAAYVEG
ncbi:MAG TPA: DUF4287 domain-containing protein [Actinomycetota bacterium]|nr:DUF4287 domain-containing protein [Actinomycetota bacterium]